MCIKNPHCDVKCRHVLQDLNVCDIVQCLNDLIVVYVKGQKSRLLFLYMVLLLILQVCAMSGVNLTI